MRLELDHAFEVEGDGTSGGQRRAAGTNRLSISLERVERTLSGLDESASPLFAPLQRPTSEKVHFSECSNAMIAYCERLDARLSAMKTKKTRKWGDDHAPL